MLEVGAQSWESSGLKEQPAQSAHRDRSLPRGMSALLPQGPHSRRMSSDAIEVQPSESSSTMRFLAGLSGFILAVLAIGGAGSGLADFLGMVSATVGLLVAVASMAMLVHSFGMGRRVVDLRDDT